MAILGAYLTMEHNGAPVMVLWLGSKWTCHANDLPVFGRCVVIAFYPGEGVLHQYILGAYPTMEHNRAPVMVLWLGSKWTCHANDLVVFGSFVVALFPLYTRVWGRGYLRIV